MAALEPSGFQNPAAARCRHPGPETVGTHALSLLGLVRSFRHFLIPIDRMDSLRLSLNANRGTWQLYRERGKLQSTGMVHSW